MVAIPHWFFLFLDMRMYPSWPHDLPQLKQLKDKILNTAWYSRKMRSQTPCSPIRFSCVFFPRYNYIHKFIFVIKLNPRKVQRTCFWRSSSPGYSVNRSQQPARRGPAAWCCTASRRTRLLSRAGRSCGWRQSPRWLVQSVKSEDTI